MGQIESFLAMGGYGVFVWGAYGVCAVVLAGLIVTSLRRLRASETALRHLEQRRGGRGRAAETPHRRGLGAGA